MSIEDDAPPDDSVRNDRPHKCFLYRYSLASTARTAAPPISALAILTRCIPPHGS